ncbi:MAG: hypothetical protein AAF828_10200 [Bacteroidota bacterium]
MILLFAVSTSLLAGGPWPQKKGKGYFKLSEWWVRFDQHFTSQGKLDPNITTGVYNTTLYAEYGFTDRLTGVLNFPFFSRNTVNNIVSGTTGETITPGEAINSIGDTELGIRYGLSEPGARLPIAISLTLGLPFGIEVAGAENNLQTGDGEFNQLLQAHVGSSFKWGKSNAYWSAQIGVNNRTNGFSDEFRWGVEAGVALAKNKLWLISRLNAVASFFNGDTAEDITSTSIFANNAEFISFGGEVNYYFTNKLGLSVGAAGAFTGRIIAAAPSFNVGVFLDLQ